MMKKKRRFGGDDELNITSMMDMMTIILVFLLKSVGSSEVEVRTSDNLKLPYSTNKAPPILTVSVVVQKDLILVDGKEVANVQSATNPNVPNVRDYFVDGSEKTGMSINKLFDELNDKKEVSKVLETKTKGQIKFDGKMVLQFDQNIPYSLIREVMFTAGKAEFFDFQFVLIQK
jgi:biopolymer transport protein ExbD